MSTSDLESDTEELIPESKGYIKKLLKKIDIKENGKQIELLNTKITQLEKQLAEKNDDKNKPQTSYNTNQPITNTNLWPSATIENDKEFIKEEGPKGISKENTKMLLDTVKGYIKKKEGEDDKYYIDSISEVMKYSFAENLHNKGNDIEDESNIVKPKYINSGNFDYNSDKVRHKQSGTWRQLIQLGNGISFKEWIEQFKYLDLTSFGEKEFNVYIYGNLTEDQKTLLNKSHINPFRMDNRTFMDNLSEILLGGTKNIMDIENEIMEFTDSGNSIMGIVNSYEYIIEQFPDSYMVKSAKEQRIKLCVMKYLPSYILTVLREKENEKIGGAMSLPTFKKFLSLHKTDINKSLSCKKNVIKKIVKNQIANENPAVTNMDLYNQDQQLVQIENDPSIDIVNKIKMSNNKKCSICKTYYHNEKECIYNPDKDLRNQNLIRVKVKSCLLCKDLNHDTQSCNIFKDCIPTHINCKNCEDNEIYLMKHNEHDCVKFNFLDHYKQKKQKK